MDVNSALWILSTIAEGFLILLGIAAAFTVLAIGAARKEYPYVRRIFHALFSEGLFWAVLVTHLTLIFYCLIFMFFVSEVPESWRTWIVGFAILVLVPIAVTTFILLLKIVFDQLRPQPPAPP